MTTRKDYRLRFHLGAGTNFMKWQLRNKKEGILKFFDTDEFYYIVVDGKLNNSRKVAEQIHGGSNKTVCSWISFSDGFMSNDTIPGLTRISYNPKINPFWSAVEYDQSNIDGFEGTIFIKNKSLYVIQDELEMFFDKKRSVSQQRELLICKNNNQHVVHYYKDTKQKVCMVCG